MALRGDTVRTTVASGLSRDQLDPTNDAHGDRVVSQVTAPVSPRLPSSWPDPEDGESELGPLPPELIADLEAPRLVLSDGYVGPDRRGSGRWARARRATFTQRRAVLSLELLLAAVVIGVVLAAAQGIGLIDRSSAPSLRGSTATSARPAGLSASLLVPLLADPLGLHPADQPTAPIAHPAATAPAASTAAAAPAPASAPPAPAAAPAPAPPPTAPPTTVPPVADPTPQQLGAQALALISYPWQRIPGYSIQFEPIADAPSPGFYGNTTFTWGQVGGTSILYVYPGETVDRLAGITAFEIAHEVDAAAVEPQGGETQIENILGIHPASWAPDCDCAEQDFLSGWYAAAFSDYWSPGVGDWSDVAPEPTGATLAAIEPWLNPTIP
jgi:hypothetical protein